MLTDLKLVREVQTGSAHLFDSATGPFIRIQASGTVPTSGWSSIRLSPWYYVTPPSDGILDVDFAADSPSGYVLEVLTPVSAEGVEPAPEWLKGVRFRAATNSMEIDIDRASADSAANILGADQAFITSGQRVIFEQEIAVYDDSFQPIGFCSGFGSIKMKKLRHRVVLTVEGPDGDKIRRCFQEATGAGLIAAIIAVVVTGGTAFSAAIATFKAYLISCLGDGFDVRVERKSHWIEWCT